MNMVMSMDENAGTVKSADRVLDVFELLARSGGGMSHGEMAEALRIPKSSLSQILKNLIARGYVETVDSGRGDNGRGHRLGQALIDLSAGAARMRNLAGIAEVFLAEITRQTRESSALNVLRGDVAEVVATVLGPQRLVTHMRVGDVAPLYTISGGKAILAFMPERFRADYLARVRFEAFTPRTIGSVARLKQEIAQVRKRGTAVTIEEFTPGIAGIAVPLLDGDGVPLGALNVAIPASRYNADVHRIAELALKRAGDGICRQVNAKPR
jgi:DNA-binding IclR family transcriptional regulator